MAVAGAAEHVVAECILTAARPRKALGQKIHCMMFELVAARRRLENFEKGKVDSDGEEVLEATGFLLPD